MWLLLFKDLNIIYPKVKPIYKWQIFHYEKEKVLIFMIMDIYLR
jgi:hypothetical protein